MPEIKKIRIFVNYGDKNVGTTIFGPNPQNIWKKILVDELNEILHTDDFKSEEGERQRGGRE